MLEKNHAPATACNETIFHVWLAIETIRADASVHSPVYTDGVVQAATFAQAPGPANASDL